MNINFKITIKIVHIVAVLSIFSIVFSCKKKGEITYPNSTNYGENIFNLPDGKLIPGESYSFEANLEKNSTLTVEMTNLSEKTVNPKPIWAFDFVKGWKAGNYVNETQIFETVKVGNNDFKIVFSGTNGNCRLRVFENGSLDPAIIKNFTW
jgi:hypothetical protein